MSAALRGLWWPSPGLFRAWSRKFKGAGGLTNA
jgi:hypothetical protein